MQQTASAGDSVDYLESDVTDLAEVGVAAARALAPAPGQRLLEEIRRARTSTLSQEPPSPGPRAD
ncbi:hypothetical protein [Streptomyces anulatus]|uniref:Uncharacterized protein n=1 Tax=Streptomyces anulatus TaxID=1892 RepID=A0A7K3R459_STRAQ|nr:hypothetical protein [Streptomyces anulatus]NEB96905.1 hypothetical protein [Streptomyces anulatus]NED27683.1 hypothetical protein [Streptomyces anulatus]